MYKLFDELFASLEEKFNHDCIINKCEEHDTKINCNRNKFEHILIFKGEKLQNKLLQEKRLKCEGRICDCFIYCTLQNKNSLTTALVELKSGRFEMDEIKEKFDNSVRIMETMIHSCVKDKSSFKPLLEFYPILIHKGISPAALKVLKYRKVKINFKGNDYSLILKRDNENPDLFKIIEEN